jgi:non-heme chloroperoxidase
VVAFLDAVGIERASVVGHSLGSFIARRVAETHPERVTRLVLTGSAVTAANEVLLEVQASVRTLEDPVPAEFAREFQSSTAYVLLPEAFFEQIVAESRKLPARLWREVLDGVIAFDDAADLGRIAAPTLLLWGEHDALFPREQQDRLVAAIRSARLMVYPETGHCPNSERVAADLHAFLQEG